MSEQVIDILILEPDTTAASAISSALPARMTREFARTIGEVEVFLQRADARLFLCADDLPGETGLMFLARTKESWPDMKRVLMAPELDGELFFHAMREVRIFSYLNKPVERGELIRTVHHAVLDHDGGIDARNNERGGGSSQIGPWLRVVILWAAIVLGGLVTFAALLISFAVLYETKSVAGIDIFPDWHLADLFRR
jgi:DNA-binding NtrC family response regulator